MNVNNAAKVAAPVAGGAAAVLGAPLWVCAVALVAAGGLCAAMGALASNAKEANVHADKNGIDVNIKK